MVSVKVGICIHYLLGKYAGTPVCEVKTILKKQLIFVMRQLCGSRSITTEPIIVRCDPFVSNDMQKIGICVHCMEGKRSEVSCASSRTIQSLLEEYCVDFLRQQYGGLVTLEQVIVEREPVDVIEDDDDMQQAYE
jgi:hypothetical protein